MSTVLQDLLLTADLPRRISRPLDLQAENAALTSLAREFAGPSGNVFKPVTDAVMNLCPAHSAGISLIERDGVETVFRWVAVSGAWARYEGGSLPRNASPCGLVLDSSTWQLMANPESYFLNLKDADPPIAEVLLVPFQVLAETVGTVWAISHDAEVTFDSEDLRVLESLAEFASAAYLTRERLRLDDVMRDELSRSNVRLTAMNEKLWKRLDEDKDKQTPVK